MLAQVVEVEIDAGELLGHAGAILVEMGAREGCAEGRFVGHCGGHFDVVSGRDVCVCIRMCICTCLGVGDARPRFVVATQNVNKRERER